MAIQETVSSAAANGKHGHSLISDEKFHQLYTLALEFHLTAERGAESLSGREAALAAISADLRPEDLLISEHPWPLIEPSANMSSDHHPHLQPVAAMGERMVHALSAAVADRMRRNRKVTVLLFPDQWAGDLLQEARKIVAAVKLPVIFVEQGNEQAAITRGAKVHRASNELISIPVDAHDVIAMYRVAHESILRARHGSGPTRIVCFSVPAARDRGMQRGNAVANLENWLLARGLPVETWRQEIVARCASRNSPERQDGRDIPQNAA